MSSNLGNAYVIALAIYARDTSLPLEDIADNLYHAVDVTEFGSEERKADLYAQLVDNLAPDTTFESAVSIIECAMDKTDRGFPHG